MNNSFGNIYRITTFGESHGPAIGGIIDGVPSNFNIDESKIQEALRKRRPGQSNISTLRNEADNVKILSGVFEGKTLGSPIGFIIMNNDTRSNDYNRDIYRPSHADFTYDIKYGIRDHRGGGRASARETACRVVAGEIARQIIKQIEQTSDVKIYAYTSQIGDIKLDDYIDLSEIYNNSVRCPNKDIAKRMENLIEEFKESENSIGGQVTGIILDCPIGLGEPIYNKFQANLASAMMSIPGTKGFEYGLGFESIRKSALEINDEFKTNDNKLLLTSNNSGGIQGGITNGQAIYFNVAFKPTPSISKEQNTINSLGDNIKINIKGRHDPCIVPRAVAVVEAMTYIVMLDQILMNESKKHY